MQLPETELRAGLPTVQAAPMDNGVLELIVRRPAVGEREILEEGFLNLDEGLSGDTWKHRGSSRTADGSPHPDMQLTIMNSRAAQLVAGSRDRWALAGDQLFVDLNVGAGNLPPGTRLRMGDAVIEITPQPHTGCKKFVSHFGMDAVKFVNSPVGKELSLRGIYARVVQPGRIRSGDRVSKIAGPPSP